MPNRPTSPDPPQQLLLPFPRPSPTPILPDDALKEALRAVAQLLIQVVADPVREEQDHDTDG